MAKTLHIAGLDSNVQAKCVRLVREIDPAFAANRKMRWASRPASLCFGENVAIHG